MKQPYKDVTVHMMIRNESPTCFYALRAIIPHVGRVLVADTGSTDDTVAMIKAAAEGYRNRLSLSELSLPDSTGWSFHRYSPKNPELSNVRRQMIDETDTKFIWVVDGDEVYRDITVQQCVKLFQDWPDRGIRAMYIPLLWFGSDIYHLAASSPPTYGVTGRLFQTEGLGLKWTYPGEMHTYKGWVLGPETEFAQVRKDLEPFHHYEMTMKPWRRRIITEIPYEGPQPEVFGLSETVQEEKVLA